MGAIAVGVRHAGMLRLDAKSDGLLKNMIRSFASSFALASSASCSAICCRGKLLRDLPPPLSPPHHAQQVLAANRAHLEALQERTKSRPISNNFLAMKLASDSRAALASVWGDSKEDLEERSGEWNTVFAIATDLISATQASMKVLTDATKACHCTFPRGGNHWSDIPSLRQQHACRKYDKLEAQSIEKRKAEEKRANEVLKAQQREEREARKLAVAEAKTRMKLAAAKAAGLAPPKSNKHIEKNDTKIMDIASDAHIFLSVMQVEDFQAQSKNIGLVMGELVLIAASSPWQSQEWSSTRLRSNAVWGGGSE